MSTFNVLNDEVNDSQIEKHIIEPAKKRDPITFDEERQPFDIQTFVDEIKHHTETKNRAYAQFKQSISGYSIAHDCISNVVKKILGHPVKSYAQSWLPVLMRSQIGTAIHEFIQYHSAQFTEIEPSIKIPSINFSGRMDCLIGNNVLVEIKSVPYSDYKKIISSKKPRIGDFYQLMTYKHILENHLEEAKDQPMKSDEHPNGTRTPPPALDKYNTKKLQLIYIAHDLSASDTENLGKSLKDIAQLKRSLNSKSNQFHFITSVVLDTDTFDVKPYLDFVEKKIEKVNYYVKANKLPTIEDEFVDTKKCFFCLYKPTCELI